MPALKITVLVEKDGQPAPGYPYVRRINVDELQVFDPYLKVADIDALTFTTLPLLPPVLSTLLVRADRVVTLRLDNQTDSGITINPGGLIMVLDAIIDSGASLNAKINNHSGVVANVRGFGAGT